MNVDRETDLQRQEFLNKIPNLTRSILTGNERHRSTALPQLLEGIRRDPAFDPVLFTIEEAQSLIKLERGRLRVLRNAAELIETTVREGRLPKDSNAQPYISLDDPRVITSINNVLSNNKALQAIPGLYRIFPGIYEFLVEQTLPYALTAKQNGVEKLLITSVPGEKVEDANKAASDHTIWDLKVGKLLNNTEEFYADTETRDTYIDLLKEEPDVSQITGEAKIIEAHFANTSIAEIGEMNGPLSKEEVFKITDYVIAALAPAEQDPMILATRRNYITKLFLLGSTIFHKEFGRTEVRNKNILANINNWQEALINQFIMGGDPQVDERLKKLLEVIHPSTGLLLLQDLSEWAVRPHVLDPNYDYAKGNLHEIIRRHPLISLALLDSSQFREEPMAFQHLDEIGYEFLQTVLIPRFRERIEELGYAEKFREGIDEAAPLFKESVLRDSHIKEIKKSFEYMCGPDFLEKLNQHADKLEEIAYTSWHSLFDQGMHYLPMSQGINIIEFSENSIPNMLGFKSLKVVRLGTPQDWAIALEFSLKAGSLSIIGRLNQQGFLHINDPISEQIPQLYKLLSLIAILTFHDLVVQDKAQREEREKGRRIPHEDYQDLEEEDHRGKEQGIEVEVYRSFRGFLPRRQTDEKLIKDVYKHTHFTPRRVEIHRRWLPGSEEYQAAIALFNEAKASNASVLTMDWVTQELKEARKRSAKASVRKVKNIPPHLQLEHITDPVSGEVRYLRTWVVEHTSPKPSEDELRSPVRLYERYYNQSSALSFLDQMKPWFIEE